MARKQNLKLSVPLPAGVTATAELQSKAEAAVKKVISDLGAYASHAAHFQALGYQVTAADLLKLSRGKTPKAGGRKPGKVGRSRVVLTDSQRSEITEMLRGGATARAAAEKYGVSSATVNNIKKEAGLVKGRS